MRLPSDRDTPVRFRTPQNASQSRLFGVVADRRSGLPVQAEEDGGGADGDRSSALGCLCVLMERNHRFADAKHGFRPGLGVDPKFRPLLSPTPGDSLASLITAAPTDASQSEQSTAPNACTHRAPKQCHKPIVASDRQAWRCRSIDPWTMVKRYARRRSSRTVPRS